MAGLSLTAVADDLTGAAEIAAIGHRFGLNACICTRSGVRPAQSGLTVYDTDSRLLPAAEATLRLEALGHIVSENRPRLVYKKTDSVLRGHVAAEVLALARSLSLRRVLLVPANPSLGRTTRSGKYYINGIPLHETAFARDPHHPARSSSLIELLGSSPEAPITVIKPGDPMPDQGIVLGETATSDDVGHWAGRLDAETLPAGGAEFFQACLRQHGFAPKPTIPPSCSGPALIATGSLTPARETLLAHAASARWPVHTLSTDSTSLARDLAIHHLALVQSPRIQLDDHATAVRIRESFGHLIHSLLGRIFPGHLIVEGGATAAAISDANGWTGFNVAGEWAPGVIALRPYEAPQLLFTIKPGSYSWPESLWRQLDTCFVPAAQS